MININIWRQKLSSLLIILTFLMKSLNSILMQESVFQCHYEKWLTCKNCRVSPNWVGTQKLHIFLICEVNSKQHVQLLNCIQHLHTGSASIKICLQMAMLESSETHSTGYYRRKHDKKLNNCWAYHGRLSSRISCIMRCSPLVFSSPED